MINKQLIKQLSKEDIEYIVQVYVQGLKDLTLEVKDNPSLTTIIDAAMLIGDNKLTFDLVYKRMKL